MQYSQEQMEFAHLVVFRLKEILQQCPSVDPDICACLTVHQKSHARCYTLMVLLAEITNLPEYLTYLGNHPDTKTNPYGFITQFPPAREIVRETVDLENEV